VAGRPLEKSAGLRLGSAAGFYCRTKEGRRQARLPSTSRLRFDQLKTPVKWLQVKGFLNNLLEINLFCILKKQTI